MASVTTNADDGKGGGSKQACHPALASFAKQKSSAFLFSAQARHPERMAVPARLVAGGQKSFRPGLDYL
jgi:hypothetical protein